MTKPMDDGYFYHTIDLPGRPTIVGAWDLRGATAAYLGNVDLRGRRVLEMGAANGYISFHLERSGARVVPYDLSPDFLGDIMEAPGLDLPTFHAQYRATIRGLNRAWTYARDAFGSRLSLTHGTAYALPEAIGRVDVTFFGSILLHLRDPFTALARAAAITDDAIIVTDTLNAPVSRTTEDPILIFNPTSAQDPCTWWFLSPEAVKRMLLILGFRRFAVTFHRQTFRPDFSPWGATSPAEYHGSEITGDLFTVVARRG